MASSANTSTHATRVSGHPWRSGALPVSSRGDFGRCVSGKPTGCCAAMSARIAALLFEDQNREGAGERGASSACLLRRAEFAGGEIEAVVGGVEAHVA